MTTVVCGATGRVVEAANIQPLLGRSSRSRLSTCRWVSSGKIGTYGDPSRSRRLLQPRRPSMPEVIFQARPEEAEGRDESEEQRREPREPGHRDDGQEAQ